MLDSLITSKTRIKILLKFFLNSQNKGYLRNLEAEFDESSNSIRMELNKLEKAGLLKSSLDKNKKMFFANTEHPLFGDINNILKKFIGIDQIIEHIINQIGDLKAAYLTGNFAMGRDAKTIDLALIGHNLDTNCINELVEKTQTYISRKIIFVILNEEELLQNYDNKALLQIWKSDH